MTKKRKIKLIADEYNAGNVLQIIKVKAKLYSSKTKTQRLVHHNREIICTVQHFQE
jgi:hypothetical protein